MMSFNGLPQFAKEFKRLAKKYRTLPDDIEKFKKVLCVTPTGVGKNFIIMHALPNMKLVKAHLACRTLRNNHSLRIIYSYIEPEQRIDFIELYFKGEKANEDRDRVKSYLISLR
jgi:hypothetical protein